MKFEPLTTSKPTNADLARQGDQLHACLEEAHSKIDNVTIVVDEIKTSLIPKGKPAAGLSTPLTAFFRTVGATSASIGGFILMYKLFILLAPAVVALALSIDHAIRTGGL